MHSPRRAAVLACLSWVGCAASGLGAEFFDSGGVRVHYTDEGSGPVVLLLHGYAADAESMWRDSGVIDALTQRGYRVVAYDHRGHGKSDRPQTLEAYGLPMVEDARRLLDHLKIERAHFVGYSMGAVIANRLRDLHPARVISVTLAGYGEPPLPEAYSEALRQEIETNLAAMGLVDGNDPKALGLISARWREWSVDAARLGRNETPALAISGEDDSFLDDARRLADTMKGLRLVTVPGDHGSAPSQPEFVEALTRFLAARSEP